MADKSAENENGIETKIPRRSFLKKGILGAAAVATASIGEAWATHHTLGNKANIPPQPTPENSPVLPPQPSSNPENFGATPAPVSVNTNTTNTVKFQAVSYHGYGTETIFTFILALLLVSICLKIKIQKLNFTAT